MERAEEIQEIVRQHGIRRLVHFTPEKNLKTICERGLLCRQVLNRLKIPYIFTDDRLVSQHKWHARFVSVSITFPNDLMFLAVRQRLRFEPFVVLGISPEALWRCKCLYLPMNAARHEFQSANLESYSSPEALSNLFTGEGRPHGLPKAYTSDRQAEVLVETCLPPEFIREVFVENVPQKERVDVMLRPFNRQALLRQALFRRHPYSPLFERQLIGELIHG